MLPLASWLLLVRPGHARPRTVARVALFAIGLCALLFGHDVRLLAAPLELALVWLAATSVRRALRARTASDAATALRLGLTEALGENAAARAVAAEFTMLWYALFSWGRKRPAGFTAYRRAGWIAIESALALVITAESIPLHFLLPRGWALASNILHLYSLLWFVGDMRALVLRPITVAEGVLHLRIGLEWEADIPLCQIERAELTASAEGRKVGVVGTSNFLLRLRRPVELHGPLGIRRVVRLLSLQVDDPEGLHRSLAAAGLASSPG